MASSRWPPRWARTRSVTSRPMPPEFMYSMPAKSRMTAVAPPSMALVKPAIRSASLADVTSPRCARWPPSRRAPGRWWSRSCGVSFDDVHEVRQAGDPEDLAVVRRQADGPDAATVAPGVGQQADDQRDAGAVDVADIAEVEGQPCRAERRRPRRRRPGGSSSARLSRSPRIRTRTSSGTSTTWAPKRRSSMAGLLAGEAQGHGLRARVVVGRHVHRVDHVLDEEQAPAARLLLAGQLALDVGGLGVARARSPTAPGR